MTDSNPKKRKRSDDTAAPSSIVGVPSEELGGATNGTSSNERASGPALRDASNCPYMATVCRTALDFDAEAVCGVTLDVRNVYVCLVCGRWLAGRHAASPAYKHAVSVGHHLYMRSDDAEVWCLPEGYAVRDASLADVSAALRPHVDVKSLSVPRTLRGGRLVGAVALENVGASDYLSVVLQLLLVALPLRDALLALPYAAEPPADAKKALLHQLALITKRIWCEYALRPHHAPHAVARLVAEASKQRFVADKQGDPAALLAWLLNVYGRKGALSAVLRKTLQGTMEVTTLPAANSMADADERATQPFWFLTLDLPPKPLFKDENEDVLVPQVALEQLLTKYNGVSRHHVLKSGRQRTYRLLTLPDYLVLVVRRFEKTKFAYEKNRCVVQAPLQGLGVMNKSYRLVAAVVHEGECDGGSYSMVMWHAPTESWQQISDDGVEKCMPQLATLKDTYLLMYKNTDVME